MRPKTGEIVWHFQWTPAETYDFDGTNENVLCDVTVNGVKRKALMHADRNGFLYTLDRTNGKFIAGNAFVNVNWAKPRIDPALGMPMAFNPDSGKLYFAMIEETSIYQINKDRPVL